MGKYKKGDDWYIDYYAYGKRKREKIGPSKALAENVLHKRKIEIAENKYLDIRKEQKIKFEDFTIEYFNLHCKPNNKSCMGFDRHNINALKKFFSGKHLYEITPLSVEKFKAERAQEVSAATVNRNLACLKSMFNRAIEWGKAKENPVKKVKLFRENNKRLRYLEKEEIVKLLANSNKHLRSIVVVALNTGMRKGEILGLKWQDVDFRRSIIFLLNTKNGEKREIPINEQVKTALIRVRKHPESPYIFCKADGTHYGNVRKSFFTAVKKSGIINFRFHDLRHTFASQLVMSGIDLNTVRELMGHKSLQMTLRYSHLSPDHKKRAVDILSKRMDTIWTPSTTAEKVAEKHSFVTV
ncbi:MAG: site-specific integrase [Candidatus Omnitrophota bacterium]